jgi:hypothetical protein
MNDELKTCPICENAVQVGSCDAFVIHPVSPCELSGKTFLRTIWQESALVNALRAQLADAQAEIKRLTEALAQAKGSHGSIRLDEVNFISECSE